MGGELVLIVFLTLVYVYMVGWTLFHIAMTRHGTNPIRTA